MKIATSILNAKNRLECIKKLNKTDTDYIHIDTMDGAFVNNYQLPIDEVNKLSNETKKPFDIHLMVNNPSKFIKKLNYNNIKCISFHIEIKHPIMPIIELIKAKNIEVGIAINPTTDISLLKKYIDHIDKVLIMSVTPGYGGQKFIENTPDRIAKIKKLNSNIIIEVDGGINDKTINKVKKLTDICVVGSYITSKDNYEEAINKLKN